MKKIYLLRHGQTLFNLTKKRQGWCDSPLTELGIEQARKAKHYFEAHNIVFDKAYCSTSERAEDTLNLITDIDYKRIKGLKEWNFGKYEGEPESLGEPDRDFFANNLTFGDWWVKYGGEDVLELRSRMMDSLHQIAKEEGNNALVVSHGGSMWSVLTGFYPTIQSLEENNIKRGVSNLETLEFDVLEDGSLKFIKKYSPLLEEAN